MKLNALYTLLVKLVNSFTWAAGMAASAVAAGGQRGSELYSTDCAVLTAYANNDAVAVLHDDGILYYYTFSSLSL